MPIYWAFLTYMLLRAGVENREYFFMFDGIDKVLHLGIFAMLGFLFIAAFPRIRFSYFFQIILIYAFLTEILQEEMNLGRSMETLDIVADTIGCLLGYYIYKELVKRFL
ncbi:antibiotic resistance protein VanZ [Chryseobacterium aquaticum]|uniref:Antibiotic resistance protein VanZ n=2 Tax=Chryseobacterium aquaticum TaxID=452084 RepID=A0A101CFR3_9FLAO|nr:antibiotic resistance protein VanZ [Chryseobacterium aquaticum]KUJ55400.1 antibiotic resistance protein VanZ [Chryseobacterium aquaticum subsp. greenlandense]